MKPWEIKKTRDKLNKLTPEKALKLFFELYQAAKRILKDSLLAENPKLTPKQLKIKMDRLHDSLGSI